MDGAQKVLAVAKWYLALSLMIAPDTLPDVGKHQLLLLLGDWAHKAEFKEKL